MDIRQTLESGIYRMLESFRTCPAAMRSLISPIPMAYTAEPFKPFTGWRGMEWRTLKSDASGDI
jgi:hypothetical protein